MQCWNKNKGGSGILLLPYRRTSPAGWSWIRLVVDGFPCLDEAEYVRVLKEKIRTGQALILKDGAMAVGILLFTGETGSIDFMGCHPLYRKMGIPKAFLDKVMGELLKGRELSITTFREGDRAGYRTPQGD